MTTSTSRLKSAAISVPLMSLSNMVLQPPTEALTRKSNLTNSFKIENDAISNEMERRTGSHDRQTVSRKTSSNPRLRASDDSERSSKRQRTEAHRSYKTPTRVLSTNDFIVVMNEVLNSSEKFCVLNEEGMRMQSEKSIDSRSVLWKKLQDLNLHLRLSDLKIIFQTIPLHLCIQFVRFLSPLIKESETLLSNTNLEVSSENRWILLCGLESIEIILRFLSSTDTPLQLQLDSIIESTIHTISVQLQQVLAYQLSRLTNEVKFALDVQFMNSLETILRLFESFLQSVPLDSSILVPFVRVLLQILELELPDYLVFIRNVVVLLVSISQRNQDLQMMIFEELLSIMISQVSTETDQDSSFQISGQEQDSIQTTTALLLLMIQASVGLPEIDSTFSSPRPCLGPAYRLAEDFWNTIFTKLALLKTDRTDGINDCKQLIEKLIKDLLCVLLVPELPAANLMLTSFVKIVISQGTGLDHPNLLVRMISLNLLGTIALKLSKLSIQQQQDQLNLQNLNTKQNLDQWGVEDSFEIGLIKMAILDHLGRLDPMNDLIWKHGHCFLSCSLWDDRQWKLSSNTQFKQEDHELQQLLIHHIHYTNKTLERKNPMKASLVDVQQIVRSLLFAQGLGQLKDLIIKAIASTGNKNQKNAQHNANLRARSMKCLNALIEIDNSILSQEGVKQGVHNALLDSAISVRESALELIGRYIGKSEDLIMQYYYLLIRASQDSGVSVKKRALKLLFEICAQNPAFPRRTETLLVILLCIQDPEEQIQISVCKAFFQLWFNGINIQSSVKDFCSILAFANTQSSYYTLHLPSVTFWQLILNQNRTLALEIGQRMTVELFRSLTEDESDQELNPVFMALHILSTANVHFLIPEDEPCRYIFILHPHLVENNDPASDQEQQLFILLELFDSLLSQVCHHLKKDQLTELRIIFYDLMTKHGTRRVLTAACRCLCTLANGTPTIGGFVLRLLENYRIHLTDKLMQKRDQEIDPSSHRLLFLIGQICQNCTELLEQNSSLGLKSYLELFMDLFTSSNHGKLKESALEGVCMMLRVRSKLLRDFRKVDGILKQALCQREDSSLQKTALRSLTTLFKTEEQTMIQHRTNHSFSNPGLNNNNNCNLSSGIIQNLWSEICSCSLEVNQERDRGSSIRILALELINVILQGGLIAPWLSVPYLIALTADPTPSISSKALSILKSVKEKQNALFIKEASSGLSPCYVFHSSLEDISPEGVCLPVIKGFGCCYQNLIQSSLADCRKVLSGLLRPFDVTANLTSMEQEASEFRFLLFSVQTITNLKFRTFEEVLCLIHGAQNIISLRSEFVLSKLKEQSEQLMNQDNIKLSTAAATLVLLVNFRNFLKKAYSIRQSRIEEFDPRQNRKFQEEKGQVLPKKKCRFELKLSDYEIKTDPVKLQDQYFQLESLVIDVESSEDGGDSEGEWIPQSRTPTSSTASDEVQYRMKLRSRK